MIKVLAIIPILLLIEGCVYPNQQVITSDDRPGLSIVGAPKKAVLYIDGLEMGRAINFNGKPNILLLEPGTHHVEIRQGNDVLRSMDIFLGEGTKREIRLSGSKP